MITFILKHLKTTNKSPIKQHHWPNGASSKLSEITRLSEAALTIYYHSIVVAYIYIKVFKWNLNNFFYNVLLHFSFKFILSHGVVPVITILRYFICLQPWCDQIQKSYGAKKVDNHCLRPMPHFWNKPGITSSRPLSRGQRLE